MPRNRPSVLGFALIAALATLLFWLGGCGYHVVGTENHLPATVHTIAVPVFRNETTNYRIEQRLTDATVHELLARTKYHVVAKPEAGDTVLFGTVLTIVGNPVVFDNVTGRVTTVLVTVVVAVRLVDRATGNVLYQNGNLVFREPYEVSTDIPSFFEEEGPALDRMSQDFAARLVSAVMENY